MRNERIISFSKTHVSSFNRMRKNGGKEESSSVGIILSSLFGYLDSILTTHSKIDDFFFIAGVK
jgi:hypothetical protein